MEEKNRVDAIAAFPRFGRERHSHPRCLTACRTEIYCASDAVGALSRDDMTDAP